MLGGVAERSLIEGIERGTFEALVIASGSALALWFARRVDTAQRAGVAAAP